MARPRGKLFFTRLRLGNWRNFVQAEVNLAPRSIIVGPNASGKSNLLDAFRFLHDIAVPTGGLAAALAQTHRGGFRFVRSLHTRGRDSNVRVEVDVGSPTALHWRYGLSFNLRSGDSQAAVEEEIVEDVASATVRRESRGEDGDSLEHARTLVEDGRSNRQFRPLVAFFASITYSHVVPHILRDRRRWLDEDDPFGSDVLRRINATPEKARAARLGLIQDLLAHAIPALKSIALEIDNAGRPHLVVRMKFWRGPLNKLNEEHLSDGTLRLIGLLWEILEPGGPLLLEEPELSLHEELVMRLPEMIADAQQESGRQVILTTHSRALLSAPGLKPDEVLWLSPGRTGTTILRAADDLAVMAELRGGSTLAEAMIPRTAPPSVDGFVRSSRPAA